MLVLEAEDEQRDGARVHHGLCQLLPRFSQLVFHDNNYVYHYVAVVVVVVVVVIVIVVVVVVVIDFHCASSFRISM